MKIAIIIPSLAQKGPIIIAYELVKGLLSYGHNVSVFYFDNIIELHFPCEVNKIKLYEFWKIKGFDIIHTHCLRPDIFGFISKKIFKKTCHITTIHNLVEDDLSYSYGNFVSSIISGLWRATWKGLDGRVVLTDHAYSYYKSSQPNLSFHRIYNGRSSNSFKAIDDFDSAYICEIKQKFKIIGSCAVLTRRKGLEQVIKALPILEEYIFLLIGDGPAREELIKLAIELGVLDRFLMLGQKNNARDYMPYMDCYVLPSRSEGLSLALLEAVSSGIPTVCASIPQIQEIFSEKEVAYFQLDNTSSFVESINKINNEGLDYQNRALRRYNDCYTCDVMVVNYLNYYKSFFS